jgi:hypothetical protein
VAVKQIRVSDLSGRQATEEQFARLIVHEHPHYEGPITLDVPEELGELPDSDQYVSIEVIQRGNSAASGPCCRSSGSTSWPPAATCSRSYGRRGRPAAAAPSATTPTCPPG